MPDASSKAAPLTPPLAALRERAAEKARLRQRLLRKERALMDRELAAGAVRERLEKEQADVIDLEEGWDHVMLALSGGLDERLDQEKSEVRAAQRALVQHTTALQRLRQEVKDLQAAIQRLGHPEVQLAERTNDTDQSAEAARHLRDLIGVLDEAYESQDALAFAQTAIDRALRWSRTAPAGSPARHHTARLIAEAHQKLDAFLTERSGLSFGLTALGLENLAPPFSSPETMAMAGPSVDDLADIRPGLDTERRRIDAIVEYLEDQLDGQLDTHGHEPRWNVAALFE